MANNTTIQQPKPEVVRFYELACGAEYRNLSVLKAGTLAHCPVHTHLGHKIVRKLRKTETLES